MIDPQLLFLEPDSYVDFIQGDNKEGEFFDRKEIRNDTLNNFKNGKEKILECISAFANSRGGVLFLGIKDDGEIVGLDHLNENQYNELTQVKERLAPHQSQVREWYFEERRLLLIYTPENIYGICKTTHAHPKGWKREGANCLPLTPQDEERIILSKKGSFEKSPSVEVDLSLINQDILQIFKINYLKERDSIHESTDEAFLQSIGAIVTINGVKHFTNAGYLFFAKNPRGEVPGAFVRVLKYECDILDFKNPGTAIYDNDIDGSMPELLQKVRTFINKSAYFKKYSYRDPNGSGLIEEDEYPLAAAEEAVVNAIIHRDYSVPTPIRCIAYRDAFVVINAGALKQESFIPTKFILQKQELYHYPRNPKLMEWIRIMKDEADQRFVKALSEGTKSMLQQMLDMGLASPEFILTGNYTKLVLFNNFKEREEKIKRLIGPEDTNTEFANLFKLNINTKIEDEEFTIWDIRNLLLNLLRDKLQNSGWFIDRIKFFRIIAHLKGKNFKLDENTDRYIRIFPAYALQIHEIQGELYLSIDYEIQVRNISNIETLYELGLTDFRHKFAQVKIGGMWTYGKIENTNEHYARISLLEFERSDDILAKEVIPNLNITEIKSILGIVKSHVDIRKKIKELTYSNNINASKKRANKIVLIAKRISETIFPISHPNFKAYMKDKPEYLKLNEPIEEVKPLSIYYMLKEPEVRFSDNILYSNISEGLTKFGSYENDKKRLEIIPLCIKGYESGMESLIALLKSGSFRYKGIERTFGVKLNYAAIISKNSAEEFLAECERLISENPGWVGNKDLDRIFLVQIPTDEYSMTDINSPYYTIKEFLLEKGIPVQMVDSSTLENHKFKDLNLSLNIVAKTGSVPWVLPNALPSADVFIGLSYTQYKARSQLYRTMGYANVFNQYGRWEFYKGNGKAFNFDDKHEYLADLVKETLLSLDNLSDSPEILIHYSAKFSKKDIEFITNAAYEVKPNAKLVFVWINIGHNIRMFDEKIEGNGSLSRGSYVLFDSNKLYLSTTGYSPLKKTLGTPIMLEINIRYAVNRTSTEVDIKNISSHILALTKLNWASVQSVNGIPVTIKYARNIARLSSVFLRRREKFNLHPVLESTPWFL